MIESRHDRLFINGTPLAYVPLPAVPAETGPAGPAVLAEEELAGRPHPVRIQPGRLALRTFGPVRVPPGCYFMMGDNRDDSHDSRYFGCVPRPRIVGRATAIIASADPAHGRRPRGDRLLCGIP